MVFYTEEAGRGRVFFLLARLDSILDFFHKGGRSQTNKNTKHKQTPGNTQQLYITLQVFIIKTI